MKRSYTSGLTKIEVNEKAKSTVVTIVHTGNMGNNIETVSNNIWRRMGFDLSSLKLFSESYTEKGSADYMYKAVFNFNNLNWERLVEWAGALSHLWNNELDYTKLNV